MKRAQFAAAVLCALGCAVQAVLAISEWRWELFWAYAIVMVVCFMLAFWAACRMIPKEAR